MARAFLVRALMLVVALPLAAAAQTQTAVFSGGCFWGVDAVFKHVKGVTRVVSGYSGGEPSTAHYEIVSEGTTGHAESVQVTFDPSVVPLKAFYAAEDYHQDYLAHHLTQPYIVYNDLPKVENLKTRYPELYRP